MITSSDVPSIGFKSRAVSRSTRSGSPPQSSHHCFFHSIPGRKARAPALVGMLKIVCPLYGSCSSFVILLIARPDSANSRLSFQSFPDGEPVAFIFCVGGLEGDQHVHH